MGKKVSDYYSAISAGYHEQYDSETLYDLDKEYQSNFFRLQILLNSFLKDDVQKLVEVGVGEGTPLLNIAKTGRKVWGMDVSENMVQASKNNFDKSDYPSERISYGDIQDASTYSDISDEGPFDGVIAMGVMPHVKKDDEVLQNMGAMLRPGGKCFIEFRNKLFSLFTFNRYTVDFIINDLLVNTSAKNKQKVRETLEPMVRMDMPPHRDTVNGVAPGYDAILSKFHNPFEMKELFEKNGYMNVELHWYHYHPAMPYLETEMSKTFREEAISLEHETSGWRGYLLCSCYVVQAEKI